jgi:hypothetical protein
MGLIVPSLKQANEKSYFEFEEVHLNLILIAYRKILINKMRTRDAFEQALIEINSPTLFQRRAYETLT